MFNLIFEYRFIFVVICAAMAVAGFYVGRFAKLPLNSKIETIKGWLLWAVIEAERDLGSGTGKLKLSRVYGEFVEKFPMFIEVISFEKFSELVDEVLKNASHLINTNPNVFSLVEKK